MQGSVRHTPRAADSGDATSGLTLVTFELTITRAQMSSDCVICDFFVSDLILLGGGGVSAPCDLPNYWTDFQNANAIRKYYT